MHSLQPRTGYRIVTVHLAVPESIDEAGAADGINDMLREALKTHEEKCVFHDWQLKTNGSCPIYRTDNMPVEGDLFFCPRCGSYLDLQHDHNQICGTCTGELKNPVNLRQWQEEKRRRGLITP